jgi:hypothetical protein
MPSGGQDVVGRGSRLRHRLVPFREFGDKLIVARPSDGAPVVLAAPAAAVWRLLDDWTTPAAIDQQLAAAFPEVSSTARERVRGEVLSELEKDLLLERD